jgi:hypothetical protein
MHGTVDGHVLLVRQPERGVQHTALGARLAGAVAGDGEHLGVVEEGQVEVHRLLGDTFEHQERRDLLRHDGHSPEGA